MLKQSNNNHYKGNEKITREIKKMCKTFFPEIKGYNN